jgi:hypothetical protein
LLDGGHLLEGLHGGDQIHHLVGLAGRHDALRAGGEERARRLDQVAGARDLRQIERHRAVAPRRQQPPHAKAQRYPVAGQGLIDERAREPSAASSSKASTAMVALLRDPFGRPLGLLSDGGANVSSRGLGIAPAAGSESFIIVSSSPFGRRRRPQHAPAAPA